MIVHSAPAIRAACPPLQQGLRRPLQASRAACSTLAEAGCELRRGWCRVFQHTAHLCSREQQAGIVRYLLQRGFWEPLQFTPCHLWPHLRGRTLWILGDSQVGPRD